MHHVVATGQPATEYLPGYLGLCGDICWGNSHSPQVPIHLLSHQLVVISVLFSLREYQPHVKAYFSFFFLHNYHRHWTSLPFLFNHVQRSLTSLLLRVIVAHTLAKISDDAAAFILFSLVSATQRRRQLPPAAGVLAKRAR